MNKRLKLKDIADHIRPLLQADYPTCHVGTGYDVDYMEQYPLKPTAVWVYGQITNPMDDGRGYSGLHRQKLSNDIYIRVSCPRYVDGDTDPEQRLQDLHDKLSDIVMNWTPPNAEQGFVWKGSKDGPTNDSFLAADLTFGTVTRYQRSAT